MATEDDEDDTDLPPADMHAEPASTAEAAQHAAQAAAAVRQAELKERTRLEEDAIGGHTISHQLHNPCAGCHTQMHSLSPCCYVHACMSFVSNQTGSTTAVHAISEPDHSVKPASWLHLDSRSLRH